MSVVIFDKQSTIVKSINTKNGVEGQWDGKDMKGKPAKEGTYFYILNALGADGKKYNKKGKINLTR
jgi:flagellar hook assembly protein FlgD